MKRRPDIAHSKGSVFQGFHPHKRADFKTYTYKDIIRKGLNQLKNLQWNSESGILMKYEIILYFKYGGKS